MEISPRNHRAAKLSRRYFLHSSAAALGALVLGCRAGTSSSSLAAKLVGQRAFMEAQLASGLFPGAVWLVAQGDDVAVDMLGTQAIGGTAPMRRDTIFRIASMTKAVTAACMMMLIEDGQIELDAPAHRWLPELASRRVLRRIDGPLDDTVPATRDIRVRDLLAYTLGFGILFDNPPIQQRIDELRLVIGKPVPLTPHTPDEWIRLFATLPLMHQPGEAWMYTAGSLLQGVLVRRASGQDLDTFMRGRLFEPLGMKDTGFFVPPSKLERYAGCGIFTEQGKKTRLDEDGARSAYAKPPVFPAGDAGLVSTVDDYLLFARMLLNGGKHGSKQLLHTESVREMTRDQLTPEQKSASAKTFFPGFFDTHGWGYGLAISTAPDPISKVPGRYGWFGGFGTSFIVDPNRDLISIVMTQSTDYLFNGARDRFWRELYAATAS
jgi:CubicO group peptidase (beta-lactamase class C family)